MNLLLHFLSIGWFACAASMPFYLHYVIMPSNSTNPPFGLILSDDLWLGVCLMILFGFAIIGSPIWMYLSRVYGKRKAWLIYSFANWTTKLLCLFLGEGDITATIIVTAINGLPLGGQFITAGLLADVIDYEEFKSGERREAQFTMFSSFVPKVVSIPSSALPLALISAAGFVPSEGGVSQSQSRLVRITIQAIYIGFPVLCNVISMFYKMKYPIENEEYMNEISEGIILHQKNLPAHDPITDSLCKPPLVLVNNDDKEKVLILIYSSLYLPLSLPSHRPSSFYRQPHPLSSTPFSL
jgi:Na+/melibiose symporter-like transporter